MTVYAIQSFTLYLAPVRIAKNTLGFRMYFYDSFASVTLAHCYTSVGLYTISTVPLLLQPWECKFLRSVFSKILRFK